MIYYFNNREKFLKDNNYFINTNEKLFISILTDNYFLIKTKERYHNIQCDYYRLYNKNTNEFLKKFLINSIKKYVTEKK